MQIFRRLIVLWLLAVAAPLMAQSIMERLITPGQLSSSHARLEAKCNACHSSFRKEAQIDKCTACHSGIGGDVASGRGFHGKFLPAHGACASCHIEHKGRATPLVRFNRTNFNHGMTNFALTGGHTKVSCAGCHHNGDHFRGAPRTCAACHAKKDPHRGQLGRECQNCHTSTGWKQVAPFDHARTGFALVGAHHRVGCLSCHAGQRWKGLSTSCVACHAKDDAHHGSRGANCAQCHNPTGWRNATFDHSATGFPLIGAHASTACAGCHKADNSIKRPSRACFTCHAKNDVHKGGNGIECQQCHTARRWKQVNFNHDTMTKFPLNGKHEAAACEACHKQPPRVAKPPVTCFGCHARDDTHKGANGQNCEQCHNEKGWKITNFDHNTMTHFALTGSHVAVKCEVCHTKSIKEYKPPMVCAGCHSKDDAHKGALGANCGSCHDTVNWKGKVRFDHALTNFPLLGKHADVTCQQCHADKTFSAKGISCAACHADDHHKGALGSPSQCGKCHNSSNWKNWTFDHGRQTAYPLTGKHQGLICAACHVKPGEPSKLGTHCVDCHASQDAHHGEFGSTCERCHVTDDFKSVKTGRMR